MRTELLYLTHWPLARHQTFGRLLEEGPQRVEWVFLDYSPFNPTSVQNHKSADFLTGKGSLPNKESTVATTASTLPMETFIAS